MPTLLTQGAASARAYGFGAPSTAANYIEDVFSTYLYTGAGASLTITNGVDLSTKGGMVWIKSRSAATNNFLFDTVRGTTREINSNTTDAQATLSNSLTAFRTNGFTVSSASGIGTGSATYASWTFRKQAKFFDVVTYTGNGTTNNVSHSLASTPGFILIKKTSGTGDWIAICRKNATQGVGLYLNTTASNYYDGNWPFNIPPADASTLKVSWINDQIVGGCNDSGATYVAYLFAHDAGGFGATGTDNVISCGSFTMGSSAVSVSLGYEPQWILTKDASLTSSWTIMDSIRGMPTLPTNGRGLYADLSSAENATNVIQPTSTGFTWNTSYNPGSTIIYIAIRRGPMKTPTTGTSVFQPITETGDIPSTTFSAIGFPFDAVFNSATGGTYGGNAAFANRLSSRLTGLGTTSSQALITSNTTAEASYSYTRWDPPTFSVSTGWTATKFIWYFLLRAPGFFDVVCYTGTGSATTVTHNLGVAPELIITKKRSATESWWTWCNYAANSTNGNYANSLNSTGAYADQGTSIWGSTVTRTSTAYSVGSVQEVNGSGITYVSYLFASVVGVSKVGSYTGTGTTKQIDCGFTGGARFVLIKRTDSTGDWYVWDSARGIVAGNDPYLLLNSTAAEVTGTDYVDTYSAGFEISSTAPAAINANGGTFIFLAIA